MKISFSHLILLTLLLISCLGVNIFQFWINANLKDDLFQSELQLNRTMATLQSTEGNLSRVSNQLQTETTSLNQTRELLWQTGADLNQTKFKLNKSERELLQTKSILNQTLISLIYAKQEFQTLKSELGDIESSINASIQWFKSNSHMPPNLDSFTSRAYSQCIQNQALNMGCVSFMMTRELGVSYTSEFPDHLASISEFVRSKGGDCEDYSLFVKAFLNSIPNDPGVRIVGWSSSPDQFTIFRDSTSRWYVSGSEIELSSTPRVHPVVICYLTDYSELVKSGHCIVALAASPILSESDLHYLDGAITLEPQNGQYMGRIGQNYHVCVNNDLNCDSSINGISFVISDDDLYQFEDGNWHSYSKYQRKLVGFWRDLAEVSKTIE